jgi:hypothetical protein
MAVVAIVVAADHDAALHDEAPDVLAKIAKDAFEDAEKLVERLAAFEFDYSWANTVRDARPLTRFAAVIRQWPIDANWHLTTCKNPKHHPGSIVERCPQCESLLLHDPSRLGFQAIRKEQDQTFDPKKDDPFYARFTCQAPTRVSFLDPSAGEDLRFLYGLFHALYLNYKSTDNSVPWIPRLGSRIRVGRAPLWVHVINDNVFQMIPRGSLTSSRMLHDQVDQKHVHQFASSYEDSVQGAYDRSIRAESYVASILLSAYDHEESQHDSAQNATCLYKEEHWKKTSLDTMKDLPVAVDLMGGYTEDYARLIMKESILGLIQTEHYSETHIEPLERNMKITREWRKQCYDNTIRVIESYIFARFTFLHGDKNIPKLSEEGNLRKFLIEEVII